MSIRRFIGCFFLLGLLVSPTLHSTLYAQEMIPAGTIIPVVLRHSLDSAKDKPGQTVEARVAQDVPLGEKQRIRRRSRVLGKIVQIEGNSDRVTLSLRFDIVVMGKTRIPIATQMRAVAAPMSIRDAQMPTNPYVFYTNSPATWTTVQIGGDVVYRGGGPVQSSIGENVGTPTLCGVVDECGVLVHVKSVKSAPGPACAGAVADDTRPQAMWVFSADACGVYGFSGLQFKNGSKIARDGQILFSEPGRIKLPNGTGLLLTVAGEPAGTEPGETTTKPQ